MRPKENENHQRRHNIILYTNLQNINKDARSLELIEIDMKNLVGTVKPTNHWQATR